MPKEKLLVYSYYFYPHENANTNVVMPVLEELREIYDIDIFTYDPNRNLPPVEQYKGMTLYRFRLKPFEVAVSKLFNVYDRRIQDFNLPLLPLVRLVWRILHLFFTRPGLERILNEYPVRKALVQRLNNEKYKALLTLSAPIMPQMDALTLAPARRGFSTTFPGLHMSPIHTQPLLAFPNTTKGSCRRRDGHLSPGRCGVYNTGTL